MMAVWQSGRKDEAAKSLPRPSFQVPLGSFRDVFVTFGTEQNCLRKVLVKLHGAIFPALRFASLLIPGLFDRAAIPITFPRYKRAVFLCHVAISTCFRGLIVERQQGESKNCS